MKKNAPYSGARRSQNTQVAENVSKSVAPAARAMRMLPGGETAVNAVQKSKPQFREPMGPTNATTPAKATQESYTPTPKSDQQLKDKYNPQPERPNKLKKQYRGQTNY